LKEIENQKTFLCIHKTIVELTIKFRFAKHWQSYSQIFVKLQKLFEDEEKKNKKVIKELGNM
jgi:hypothetical protein